MEFNITSKEELCTSMDTPIFLCKFKGKDEKSQNKSFREFMFVGH
jgi:hypothetical protein